MAAFDQRNEAPIKFAALREILLWKIIWFSEISYYFSKRLFDGQVHASC